MRLPSGYGSVVKLSGKRRRPFAVRTSTIQKYLNIYIGEYPAESVHKALVRFKFAYKRKQGYWTGIATDKVLEWADTFNNIERKIEYRQAYIFHAYFAKREEALKYLATLNSGNRVKEHTNLVIAPTFAKVYKEMIDHLQGLKRQLTKGTYDTYKAGFNNLAAIHNIRIDALRPADIQVILNENNGKSYSGIGFIRKVLQKVETYALMQHYITDGYMKYLIFEYTESEEEIHKPFSDEEIKFLWDNIDLEYVNFVLATIYTGLRPSELLNIKTENVHLDEKYMIGGMKTAAGRNRTIPISDRIYDVIQNMYDAENEYLFPRHTTYRIFQKHYARCMKRLSLDHKPHDGRHTFATLMDRYGANQICTKMIIGHALSDITESVYTHKELPDLLEAVNLIKI
ncbi:MAG: tyrosine-type recombinase/integrase [Lachnospiraceae bacterium]|nr:tyrosine-type recombinase/integrase [Lachnospiraceae bacterium]